VTDEERDDDGDTPADDLPEEPLADLAADVGDRPSDSGEEGDGAERHPRLDADTDREPSALPGDTGREGPLGELAADVERRRDAADNADAADLDDAFTSQEVADLDVDAVWEQVESDGVDDEQAGVETEERVVSKASFCQQCEFFSEPPAVGCGHEGTEILELVDTERFRVRNCPKVAEEERLGDL